MPRHELVARDAVQHGVHDRPLRVGRLLAARGLGGRQRDGGAAAEVDLEATVGEVHAGPHDLARPGDAVEGRAARREEHRVLAPPLGARVAALEVRGRDGAGDLEDPHEAPVVVLAPAHVVQGGRGVQAHRLPQPVGHQRVDRHALVGLVEVRERLPVPQDARAVARADRRALDVVHQALGQVGRGGEVLEALLVLDAHRVEAEVVGDAQRGDVHLVLPAQLGGRELRGLVGAEPERHARVLEPRLHLVGLGVGHALHLGPQRGLRQALLVDADPVEELVVEDRVVHAHAALVEHADDGLLGQQLGGQRLAEPGLRGGRQLRQRVHVGRVVRDGAGGQPLADRVGEPGVGAVDGPDRRVVLAHLGQAGVEPEQAHEAGPVGGEVRRGEDRAAVGAQPGEHVMAVLPDRLGHDQRRLRRDAAEDLEPHALAADEPVPGGGVDVVGAHHLPAVGRERVGEDALQADLGGPARRVRGLAQVARRDEVDGVLRRGGRVGDGGDGVGVAGHGSAPSGRRWWAGRGRARACTTSRLAG